MLNSAFDCGAAVQKALQSANSLEEINTIATYWYSRFENAVVALRGTTVGLQRSVTDLQLIRDAIADEIPDEKDLAKKLGEKAVNDALKKSWKTLYLVFKQVGVFLDSPPAKQLGYFLKASQSSEIATDYDDLLAADNRVNEAVRTRAQQIDPTYWMLSPLADKAYTGAEEKLYPQFNPAPALRHP